MVWVWLAVAVIFGVAEVATVAFFASFISVGALAAALVAAIGAGVVAQLLAFVAFSLLGLVAVRPFAMHRLRRPSAARLVSGAEAMIGQTALVVDQINGDHEPGHVLISGERWPAITAAGTAIQSGQRVMVVELRQATLVVAPV